MDLIKSVVREYIVRILKDQFFREVQRGGAVGVNNQSRNSRNLRQGRTVFDRLTNIDSNRELTLVSRVLPKKLRTEIWIDLDDLNDVFHFPAPISR